jgi:hypothetical protein
MWLSGMNSSNAYVGENLSLARALRSFSGKGCSKIFFRKRVFINFAIFHVLCKAEYVSICHIF